MLSRKWILRLSLTALALLVTTDKRLAKPGPPPEPPKRPDDEPEPVPPKPHGPAN